MCTRVYTMVCVCADFLDFKKAKKVVMHPLSMADLGCPEILEFLDKCEGFVVRFKMGAPSGTTPQAPKTWNGSVLAF